MVFCTIRIRPQSEAIREVGTGGGVRHRPFQRRKVPVDTARGEERPEVARGGVCPVACGSTTVADVERDEALAAAPNAIDSHIGNISPMDFPMQIPY